MLTFRVIDLFNDQIEAFVLTLWNNGAYIQGTFLSHSQELWKHSGAGEEILLQIINTECLKYNSSTNKEYQAQGAVISVQKTECRRAAADQGDSIRSTQLTQSVVAILILSFKRY